MAVELFSGLGILFIIQKQQISFYVSFALLILIWMITGLLFTKYHSDLSKKYKFNEQPRTLFWMSIGKNGNSSVFLTLKGNQKTKDKYLKIYNSFVV